MARRTTTAALAARVASLQEELESQRAADRDELLAQAAEAQRLYQASLGMRRKFVQDFFNQPAGERVAEAQDVAEAMGISRATFYQIKNSRA